MSNPYVINLDSRPDRWETINQVWNGAFELTKVPAVSESPGWIGCGLSHVRIIEDAKQRGDPYVLVWEDDCMPFRRIPSQVRTLWNEVLYKLSLCRDKWDVVTGGTTSVQKGAFFNQELSTKNVSVYDLPHGLTTHWILYNSSAYDRMIEWKTLRTPQIDVYLFNVFRVKVVVPFLAEQNTGYSDIESRQVNYHDMFHRTELDISQTSNTLSKILKNAPAVYSPKFMTR